MLEAILSQTEIYLQSDIALVSLFVIWLITFLTGENGALLALVLAFQGYLPIQDAILFSFLGSLSADIFWYGMTVSTIRPWIEKKFKKKFPKKVEAEQRSFFALADTHPYIVLVFIKFLVGIRLFLTVYIISKKNIPFIRYVIVNVFANILFIAGLTLLAWFFSESTEYAFKTEQTITHLFTLIVVVSIGGNIVLRFLEKVVLKIINTPKEKK
ncbi:hypothetical protein IPH92_03360 [Candidatus Kaiserbacteria bacterium]|nr:MAG: hypothetical protein IPH92_03360 [Candidatus Kaiserbacteria bacterium]